MSYTNFTSIKKKKKYFLAQYKQDDQIKAIGFNN